MQKFTAALAIMALLAPSGPALAQPTTRPAPGVEPQPVGRPTTRPVDRPGAVTRPAPQPGFGGSGGSWQGGNRPPPPPVYPPVRPPIQPPPPPPGHWQGGNNWGGSGGSWQGGYGRVRCESWNYRYAECRADTGRGVRLDRVIAGSCRQGYSWGTRRDRIWVNHGCRADFWVGGGWGGGGGHHDDDRGPSAGAVIGGVAVAAGLIALLASSGNSKSPPPTASQPQPQVQPTGPVMPGNPGGPARINADLGGLTPDARPSFNNCLGEAARQIGATGGTEIGIERFDEVVAGNGGWRIRARLRAVYPDETRSVPVYCRATPTSVIELSFG